MCEFLSFVIAKTPEGLKILAAADLSSHDEIISKYNLTGTEYYEAEWTISDEGDELLTVRTTDETPAAVAEKLADWVRAGWSDRQKLINHLCDELIEAGELPNMMHYQHPNWHDRTMWLFACDCADMVLPIYEKSHPDDTRVQSRPSGSTR